MRVIASSAHCGLIRPSREPASHTAYRGAIKAPSDFPYINDWACSSNGAWCNIIIESIFGVRAGLDRIEAVPQFGKFDRNAVLRNLRWQGRNVDVTRDGIRK